MKKTKITRIQLLNLFFGRALSRNIIPVFWNSRGYIQAFTSFCFEKKRL